MIRLRILSDGTVLGLWTDAVKWTELGPVKVRRASHVEFDEARHCWCVLAAQPISRMRSLIQGLHHRPTIRRLYHAATRSAALEWEREHFGPGGPGWELVQRTRTPGNGQTISRASTRRAPASTDSGFAANGIGDRPRGNEKEVPHV